MTILETASLWVSAGALIGAPIAWASFVRDRERERRELVAGVDSTYSGIFSELGLVAAWASADVGGKPNLGYVRHGNEDETREWYRELAFDWCDPRRMIFGFDWPAIKSFATSPYRGYFRLEGGSFTLLNYSLEAFFGLYSEFRAYVLARPELFDAASGLTCHEEIGDPALRAFRDQVFNYNFSLHVGRVGGATSTDAGCLYRAYRAALKGYTDSHAAWEREKPRRPWWYWIGHVAAFASFVSGAALLLAWTAWAAGIANLCGR